MRKPGTGQSRDRVTAKGSDNRLTGDESIDGREVTQQCSGSSSSQELSARKTRKHLPYPINPATLSLIPLLGLVDYCFASCAISSRRKRTGMAKLIPDGLLRTDSLLSLTKTMLMMPTTSPRLSSYRGPPLLPG